LKTLQPAKDSVQLNKVSLMTLGKHSLPILLTVQLSMKRVGN